ncbi:MAG: hypothetical protein IT445_02910 [Phycisphaeraceae bacterium]|nr:hypothetical protein [Phycisphaeraceae bacterium]
MRMFGQPRIEFREHRPDDLPGIRALWRDDAQWGDVTPEMWQRWYVDIPNGPAVIVVGEDAEGRIVAQTAMTPQRLVVDDQERLALLVAAPIVSRRLQGLSSLSVAHPVVRMLMTCNKLGSEKGFAALYAMPRQTWLQLLKLAPLIGVAQFYGEKFNCSELKLNQQASAPPPPSRLKVVAIEQFGPQYQELWDAARRNLPIECGVVREPAYLNYRNGGHLCLEMRSGADDQLVGYVAVRKDGQVMDMLPRDRSWLADILSATWWYVACEADDAWKSKMHSLRFMRTPLLSEHLDRMPFKTIRFRFAFACRPLEHRLTQSLDPSRWYLTPNG